MEGEVSVVNYDSKKNTLTCLLGQWTESPLATDYLNPLLGFSIRLSWTFSWIKLRKKKHGMILLRRLSFCRDCRGGWALRAKGTACHRFGDWHNYKRSCKKGSKTSCIACAAGQSPLRPSPPQPPPSCWCCSRNGCGYGFTFSIAISTNITLELVYIIQCAAVIIRKERHQADLKSIHFENTFIKVWFKLRNSKNKKIFEEYYTAMSQFETALTM